MVYSRVYYLGLHMNTFCVEYLHCKYAMYLYVSHRGFWFEKLKLRTTFCGAENSAEDDDAGGGDEDDEHCVHLCWVISIHLTATGNNDGQNNKYPGCV